MGKEGEGSEGKKGLWMGQEDTGRAGVALSDLWVPVVTLACSLIIMFLLTSESYN